MLNKLPHFIKHPHGLIAALSTIILLVGCQSNTAADFDEQHKIELGQTLSGEFAAMSPPRAQYARLRNIHYYIFEANEDQPITITATSESADLSLQLHRSDKIDPYYIDYDTYAVSDYKNFNKDTWKGQDYTPGPHAELLATLPKSKNGKYSILVKSREAGKYTISLKQGRSPTPGLWQLPKPIAPSNNTFISPFARSGELASWTVQAWAYNATGDLKTEIMKALASQLTQAAVGSLSGSHFNKAITLFVDKRNVLLATGGWEGIYKGSELAFNTPEDLALYLHLNNLEHPNYSQALELMFLLYPELQLPHRSVSGLLWGTDKAR